MGSLISENRINKIFLMLGDNCNFKCRHCVQKCNTDYSYKSLNLNKDVIDYIWHLINIRNKEYGDLTLFFWGGEPLIYFDKIKEIINIYRDKLRYVIITNGKLLSNETVEYINKNNISIALSNDGIDTDKIRDTNLLENDYFIEIFKKINNKSINAVIHSYNHNYQKLENYITSKLGDIDISIEQLNVTWEMPKDIYNMNYPEYVKSIYDLSDVAYQDIINGKLSFAVKIFYHYLDIIANGRFTKRIIPNCMQIYRTMNIDLQGNVYACHNSTDVIGKVTNNRLELINNYDKWLKNKWNNNCIQCQYFELCRGGCPLEITNGDNKLSCKRLKIFYQCCFDLAYRLNNYFEPIDCEID